MLNLQILRPKLIKRNISGVLLLNKPSGISSHQALQIAKRIFSASKAGHTGTLDPMATGLLPVCFGEATKFSSVLLGADKTYEATLRLGYISTTGDSDGEISVAGNVNLTLQQVESVLQNFIGKIMQTPPMYSAVKHQGKPLYTYARKGIEIERQPREVTVYDLRVGTLEGDKMNITIRCSTGTYVRTLAENIGRILGCGGAYLTSLCRNTIDGLDLLDAYTLDMLEGMPLPQRDACLSPVDSLLLNLPAVFLDSVASVRLLQGRMVTGFTSADRLPERKKIRLYDGEKRFLGLGEITAYGEIIPKRLMVLASTNPLLRIHEA
ncbi:MAG: tRNA pseudouridine(55) synthase TruB [Nitrosomonadaceae bacterium]|nr:tRNA pseudouridine(55) synthase TruB [Pseudomonadota bacterium]